MAILKYALIALGIVALIFGVYFLWRKLPHSVINLIYFLISLIALVLLIYWIGKKYDGGGGSWND